MQICTYKSLNRTSGRSRVEFVPSVSELWAKFKCVARIGSGEGGRIRPSRLHCKSFSWTECDLKGWTKLSLSAFVHFTEAWNQDGVLDSNLTGASIGTGGIEVARFFGRWIHWANSSWALFCILYLLFCILYWLFCILYFVLCILYFVFMWTTSFWAVVVENLCSSLNYPVPNLFF